MKLKLDENLPESLVEILTRAGYDVENVRLEGLVGKPDREVWRAAQDTGRFLIIQDLDFSDIRKFAPGSHRGLMLVRLRVPGRQALASRIAAAFREKDPSQWDGWFVLLTDHKLRVRRAPL